MSLLEHIKELQELNGNISINKLEKEAGLTRGSMSKWDNHAPSYDKLKKVADYFGVTVEYLLTGEQAHHQEYSSLPASTGGVWVPVLGAVSAGIPIEAIENIEDYEEITKDTAVQGEYFGLRIQGDSMEPRITSGDVVIIRKQGDCETGDVAVVLVNGDSATVKRIKKRPEGILLIPNNNAYEPMFYSNKEIEDLPVRIIGKVVELRAKF